MDVLKDELQYSPTLAIQSLQRLLVIGRALGPERTRHDLLPYLTSEIQQGNLNDDVLFAIAEVLPQLVEFVANADDARGLLAPLRELCCAEDAAVREMAVQSIVSVGRQLPAALLAPTIVPMVLSLGAQGDWFTPRVSACGMLPLAVSLSLRVEAHAAAAAAAGTLAPAAAPPTPFVPSTSPTPPATPPSGSLTSSLTASPGGASAAGACRAAAARHSSAPEAETSSSSSGAPAAPGSPRATGGSPRQTPHGSPRHSGGGAAAGAAAGTGFVLSAGADGVSRSTSELIILFHILCTDASLEVRRAVAGAMGGVADALTKAGALAEGLGVAFVAASILPTLDELVRDESVGARVELAGVLMALARPLGAAGAASRLLPLIQLLLDDANTNVRLSVLYAFGEFMDVVGIDCAVDGEGGGLVTLVRQLGDDPNWRVRHATVLLLPALAGLMAAAAFSAAFDLERLITDATSLVRIETLKACAAIARLPSYSQRWVESDVLPVLCARHAERDYHKRAVLLAGLAELAPHTGAAALDESLLPAALGMAADPVPNLRLILCRSLQRAAPHMSGGTLAAKVLPALEALEKDDDMDVLGAAREALEVCLQLVHTRKSS